MKKKDGIIFLVDLFIGAAVAVLGITGKNGFFDSGALLVMGAVLIIGSLGQLWRFWQSRRPENKEAYEREMKHRRIEWKDERNRQIRHYAGYLTYAVTMLGCFVAAVAANLLGASNRIVFILLTAGAAEGVLFTVFEWYARRKTEA